MQSIDNSDHAEVKESPRQHKTMSSRDHKTNVHYLDSRNYMVYQEALFLALLSQYYEITISKPTKKSIVTDQFLKVKTIKIGDDCVAINDLMEKRCKERLAVDKLSGIKEGSAVRRFTLNKTTEIHHYLMDLLSLNGYMFKTKYVAGKNGSIRVELVEEVYYGNQLLFNKDDIITYGQKLNKFLYEKVYKTTGYSIYNNSNEVLNYFNDIVGDCL